MKKLHVLMAVALSVLVSACSKPEPKTPEAMAVGIYEAVDSKDIKGALKLLDSEFFTSDNLLSWNDNFEKLAICKIWWEPSIT